MIITEQMTELFYTRTNYHINLVKKNMAFFSLKADNHDQSKFSSEEILGYILLTWKKSEEKNNRAVFYTEAENQLIKSAIQHHLLNNKHHPECVGESFMLDDDIVEMTCDWAAMSEEFGENSAIHFAKKVLTEKYNFSEERENFIYSLITHIDLKNKEILSIPTKRNKQYPPTIELC